MKKPRRHSGKCLHWRVKCWQPAGKSRVRFRTRTYTRRGGGRQHPAHHDPRVFLLLSRKSVQTNFLLQGSLPRLHPPPGSFP